VDATEIGRLLSGEANTKREAPPLIDWLERSAEQSEQIGARLNLPALGAAGALIPGTLAGAYRDPLGMLDPTMVGLEGVRASVKKNPKLFWDGVTQGFGL
jgi:lysophospholipase L1-like esterase